MKTTQIQSQVIKVENSTLVDETRPKYHSLNQHLKGTTKKSRMPNVNDDELDFAEALKLKYAGITGSQFANMNIQL